MAKQKKSKMKSDTIKYRIIESNEKEHTIVVRFYSDILSEEDLRIDGIDGPDGKPSRCRTDYNLTIWGDIKTEEELRDFIHKSMPTDWFNLQHSIVLGTVPTEKMDVVSNLMHKEFEAPSKKPEPKPADPRSFTPEEIEEILKTQT